MYLFVVYEIFISIFIDVMFYNMVAFTTNYYYYYMRFSFRYSYACLVIKLFLFFKCLIFLSIDFYGFFANFYNNGSCGTAIERLISAINLCGTVIERLLDWAIDLCDWVIDLCDWSLQFLQLRTAQAMDEPFSDFGGRIFSRFGVVVREIGFSWFSAYGFRMWLPCRYTDCGYTMRLSHYEPIAARVSAYMSS